MAAASHQIAASPITSRSSVACPSTDNPTFLRFSHFMSPSPVNLSLSRSCSPSALSSNPRSISLPHSSLNAADSADEEVPIERRYSAFPTVMDINRIREILPHRFPFLLVDRVIEYTPGVSAVAIKNVTINDNFFPGHFPERPIMPGVLMVEDCSVEL